MRPLFRLISLYSFFEIRKWFLSTDDRKDFCLLTLGTSELSTEYAFSLDDTADLDDARRRFRLSPNEISRINPNTNTAPIFRTKFDAEMISKIHARLPVLIEEGKGAAGNPWGVSFMTMFHMANDSGLFRTARELNDAGFIHRGGDWTREGGTRPVQQTMALVGGSYADHLDLSTGAPSASDRYVSLYEAKMIHQFDHQWATYDETDSRDVSRAEKMDPAFAITPRYWVSEQEVDDRLREKGWSHGWLMGWRDICRATDERTVITSVFERSAVGHTLPLFFLSQEPQRWAMFAANMASLLLDFVARQKIGGTHLTYGYLSQFPVLAPHDYSEGDLAFVVPKVLELTYTSYSMAPFARDLGYEGPPFVWDENRRAHYRAELDAWYALAYGLSRDELRYVLDPKEVMGADYPGETFRVLQKNDIAKYGEYRTARLVLAAYDRLVSEGMRPRTEGYR